MTLAIFDLDNTLIDGDSDHLWGQFAHEQGIVDGDEFVARNEQFYQDYVAGRLDINAYLRFALAPLAGRDPETLAAWHTRFMREKIDAIRLPAATELIARHREAGDRLLVITATNRFITEPIVRSLGIGELLACDAEMVNGRYTGEPTGIPSYAEGKVTRFRNWLEEEGESMDNAWFYSDSHNDLPLLELIDNPVAVDPDDRLRARAEELGWPIISLR
jgi:HAD superfamily hydrolase (TIGR01490 family)